MDFREPCRGSKAFEKKMVATCRNQEMRRRKSPTTTHLAAIESKALIQFRVGGLSGAVAAYKFQVQIREQMGKTRIEDTQAEK